jgi:hypothetical protein
VSVFPVKDTTHDENLEIIDTTSSRFLTRAEFLFTDDGYYIKKSYETTLEGIKELAKLQAEADEVKR